MRSTRPIPTNGHHPTARRDRWDTDGVNGGPASINILMNWLERNDNYLRWWSANTSRFSDNSISVCAEVVQELEHNGIHHRTATAIDWYIKWLQRHYKTSCDYRRSLAALRGNVEDPDGERMFVADLTISGGRHWTRLRRIMGPRVAEQQVSGPSNAS
ncbi:hypothetical protein MJO28_010136 [Puccinia striiformis f. sp. tritici]|uniref:Uncharacterized protein n=1 Tax=Puccinia striiformis f. sp. tritici TaxID=168172 RepID=A0ACC0E467_9BASI|nr:hypothetical protein MJO28_010136 [Puccinia striiformis f. sp. tritici]